MSFEISVSASLHACVSCCSSRCACDYLRVTHDLRNTHTEMWQQTHHDSKKTPAPTPIPAVDATGNSSQPSDAQIEVNVTWNETTYYPAFAGKVLQVSLIGDVFVDLPGQSFNHAVHRQGRRVSFSHTCLRLMMVQEIERNRTYTQ